MATRRLRRKNNQTRKRKNKKKGGSVECTNDKSLLHIIIPKAMLLEGNLSEIRTACKNAIKASDEKVVKKASRQASVKKVSVAASEKKTSPESKTVFTTIAGDKIVFPQSESLTSNIGIRDGRKPLDSI